MQPDESELPRSDLLLLKRRQHLRHHRWNFLQPNQRDLSGAVRWQILFGGLLRGLARAWNKKQRILFIGRTGDAILAGTGRVNKFDFDAGTDAFNVAIEPNLEWIG